MRLKAEEILSGKWKERGLMAGDTFTSTKKVSCPFCKEKSDRWIIIGRPFDTPHLLCPEGHTPFVPVIKRIDARKPRMVELADIETEEDEDDEDDEEQELEDDYVPESTRKYMRTLERYFRLVKDAIQKKEIDMDRWTKVKAKIGAVWLSKAMYTCPECKNKTCLWTMSNYRYGRRVPVLICKLGHHSYVFDVNLEEGK